MTNTRRGSDATNSNKGGTHLVSSERGVDQQEGQQGSVATQWPVDTEESELMEKVEQGSSSVLGTHPVSREVDERIAALGNWGANAAAKNSTIKKRDRGWDDLRGVIDRAKTL